MGNLNCCKREVAEEPGQISGVIKRSKGDSTTNLYQKVFHLILENCVILCDRPQQVPLTQKES